MRSARVSQPSATRSLSCVDRLNPVVKATLMPASRKVVMAFSAPGIGSARPWSMRESYVVSKAAFAAWARSSSPKIARNTTIFDWPIVSRTYWRAASASGPSAGSPPASAAAAKARRTSPSSATVVPAMSRTARVIGDMRSLSCRRDSETELVGGLFRQCRAERHTAATGAGNHPDVVGGLCAVYKL